ncbi:MAG: hypothetical protein AMXMBFR61_13730 [Fimbriimonadales bacterium]
MQRAILTTLLILLAAIAGADLSAGVARVSLTPDPRAEKVPLGGYTARGNKKAIGVRDEVGATALVLSSGGQRFAIVSCDLLTVPASLSEAVAARLPDWKEQDLVLCATHTHCAPDSQRLNRRMKFPVPGIATFDQKALDWTAERIANAIRTADAGREPVTLWTASAEAGLSRGRRPTEASLPSCRGPALGRLPQLLRRRTAPHTEPDVLHVAEFRRAEGTPLALLVNYAAHPTIFDDKMLKISAEWPGELARCWERRNPGAHLLFLNGALGDRSPIADKGRDDDERVALYARALLPVISGARNLQPAVNGGLLVRTAVASLPPAQPHPELVQEMAAQGIPKGLLGPVVQGFAPPVAPMRLLQIGGWRVLFVPGEPTTRAGAELRRAARADFVVSFAGDWVGYVLTPEEYARGGYEATVSFHGPHLLDALLAAARSLR